MSSKLRPIQSKFFQPIVSSVNSTIDSQGVFMELSEKFFEILEKREVNGRYFLEITEEKL
jgi:hypothetical protein